MSFEEYKEKIKEAYVQFVTACGQKVDDPDKIFANVSEETLHKLHDSNATIQEAYWACALAGMQVKKGGQ